jgi:hypothetical protein
MDRHETQVRQRRDQPGDRGRIQQLEERVATGPERPIHAGPEATQAVEHDRIDHAQCYDPDQASPWKTRHHDSEGPNRKLVRSRIVRQSASAWR